MKLTQKRLKELLDYDTETGIFVWKVYKGPTAMVGDSAGCTRPDGYIAIRINGRVYKAHRLAWLWVEGYFPEHQVHHKNDIKNDNSWKNLKHLVKFCHAQFEPNNTSGIVGVHYSNKYNIWIARIKINNKRTYLGSSKDKLIAAKLRRKAEIRLGFTDCKGPNSAQTYIDNN